MKAEYIRKAAAFAGITLKDLSAKIGQKTSNFHNKIRRGGLGLSADKELEEIAEALGARYYSYFEFPDGTKIGDYPEANKEKEKDEDK